MLAQLWDTQFNLYDVESVVCPHCLGADIACCVCACEGRLRSKLTLMRAIQHIWARPGCDCPACQRVGPPPAGVTPAHPHAVGRMTSGGQTTGTRHARAS